MDHGDTRHYFGRNDPEGLAEAERRFNELTSEGLHCGHAG
jgi:hypothetical protein